MWDENHNYMVNKDHFKNDARPLRQGSVDHQIRGPTRDERTVKISCSGSVLVLVRKKIPCSVLCSGPKITFVFFSVFCRTEQNNIVLEHVFCVLSSLGPTGSEIFWALDFSKFLVLGRRFWKKVDLEHWILENVLEQNLTNVTRVLTW